MSVGAAVAGIIVATLVFFIWMGKHKKVQEEEGSAIPQADILQPEAVKIPASHP